VGVVVQTHKVFQATVVQVVAVMDTIRHLFQVMRYLHKDSLVGVGLELVTMNQQVVAVEQMELVEHQQA
jgi:hypothetical protein